MAGLANVGSDDMPEFEVLSKVEKDAVIVKYQHQLNLCKSNLDIIPIKYKAVCNYFLNEFVAPSTAPHVLVNQNMSMPCNDIRCMFNLLIPTSVGSTPASKNVSCVRYDDYFCESENVAVFKHDLMGMFALLLCVFGVLFNILFLPTINVHALRSSATLFLSGIALADMLTLILTTLIYIIQNLNKGHAMQFFFYETFSAYLIPLGVPALEFFQLLSLWFMVGLMIDRFMYMQHGLTARSMFSRKLCVKIMVAMFVLLFAYSIPKCFKYQLVDVPLANGNPSGHVRLRYTDLGRQPGFRNLMKHWLRVPIEMFLPDLMIAGFASFMLYTLINVQVNNLKRSQPPPPPPQSQMALKTAPTAESIKQSAANSEKEQNVLLEELNTRVAVGAAFVTMAFKLPAFVLHIFETETTLESQYDFYHRFNVTVQFLNVLCAALRPIFYVCLGRHYRVALRTIFCIFKQKRHRSVVLHSQRIDPSSVELKPVEEGLIATEETNAFPVPSPTNPVADIPNYQSTFIVAEQDEGEDFVQPLTHHFLTPNNELRKSLSPRYNASLPATPASLRYDFDSLQQPELRVPLASNETLDFRSQIALSTSPKH